MTSLFEILERIARQLPGCRLVSVVNQESGMPLVSVGGGDPLETAGADAYHSDMYRIVARTLADLDMPPDPRGFVLTGKRATFLSLPLGHSGYFWHIATDRSTTVGFTQAIMRKHSALVEQSLQDLLDA